MTISSQSRQSTPLYVLDANAFINAWRDHYPIDVFPEVWIQLESHCRQGNLRSIDKIREEIKSPIELVAWTEAIGEEMFVSTEEIGIAQAYSELQIWAQSSVRFTQAAKEEFATVADGWLAAYAKVTGAVVVTHEELDPNVRRRIPLPSACDEADVTFVKTIDMFRGLGIVFGQSPSSSPSRKLP